MKRPKISEENNDLLDQVNYLIEMDKYCDYLEEQNKQLSIQGVVQAKTEKVCEHIFKKSYGRSGGEKCIKCGKRI
jgi:hypothetical protein